MKFVVNTLRLRATCCRSVLWQAMCGRYLRAASKNAKIMLKISFFCLKYWLGSWRKRTSLKHGQRSHGQFGVLETSFILSELKLIQKKIMIVKWAFSKSTRGIWLLNILKRVVWPSCSICGPPIYYFFHTAMFCLC